MTPKDSRDAKVIISISDREVVNSSSSTTHREDKVVQNQKSEPASLFTGVL